MSFSYMVPSYVKYVMFFAPCMTIKDFYKIYIEPSLIGVGIGFYIVSALRFVFGI